MRLRSCYPTILGTCLAVFAASVLAQAPAPNTTTAPSTSAPAATSAGATGTTDGTSSQQTGETGAKAKKTQHAKNQAKQHPAKQQQAKQHPAKQHQAKQHHTKHHQATHAPRTTETSVNSRDNPYRTALRRCVEGQSAQRDQCLNDAIARYGRS